jgi:hypothetical protein
MLARGKHLANILAESNMRKKVFIALALRRHLRYENIENFGQTGATLRKQLSANLTVKL